MPIKDEGIRKALKSTQVDARDLLIIGYTNYYRM